MDKPPWWENIVSALARLDEQRRKIRALMGKEGVEG